MLISVEPGQTSHRLPSPRHSDHLEVIVTAEKITPERLRELLHYDPDTGIFTWRVARGRCSVGAIAGIEYKSSIDIRVDGRLYRAHRLAWLYMTGEWPVFEIDHRDRNPHNNRLRNLRDATRTINAQNIGGPKSNNTIGVLGVRKCHGKFQARIAVNGKPIHLGCFDTEAEASASYLAARRKLHPGNML